MRSALIPLVLMALAAAPAPAAIETEHLDGNVIPAPGKVTVDGDIGDWNLVNGLYACPDVVEQRGRFGVWLHTMYDAEHLYILARYDDPDPLNHPGAFAGSHGFEGDSLQVRLIVPGEDDAQRVSHWTIWKDRNGLEIADVAYGVKFRSGKIPNAVDQGVKLGFKVDDDKKGYVLEVAIPWGLIAPQGHTPGAGDRMVMTFEPNFSAGAYGRISVKDLFRPGVQINRVFTFMNNGSWGQVTLLAEPPAEPRSMRLADGRFLPVSMKDGKPVVDYSALAEAGPRFAGVAPIKFTMPVDGYVSMNILNAHGRVVRQLLTSHPFDAGEHEIAWDAQTNGIYLTPGELVDAGEYRWEAIYHEGFELTLRGWASHGGSHPWNNGKGTGWGGDHGTPHTLATDGRRVYLGWTAAEAGRAIVATDLTGQVQWRLPIGQSNCTHLATDGRTVFAFNPRPGVLYRLDAAEGFYTAFGDDDRGTISVGELFGGEAVKHIDGLAAGDGKLYLAAAARDTVVVLDAESGEKLKAIGAPKPGRMHLADDGMLYVVSDGKAVHRVDPESGKTDMLFDGLSEATSVFRHTDGRLLVSVMGDEHRVLVFSDRGERLGAIGQASAGREIGPFNPLAMANPTQCLVDAEGKLWVTESNEHPKRVSVWSIDDGGLLAEYYGPTHYGASGGAIHPADPNVMVGAACEWKLDPDTGRATCTYVIDHHSHGYATFRQGDNGRWYLLTNSGRYGTTRLQVRERTDEGRYVLRATIAGNPQGEGRYKPSRIWADANGDGEPQDSEYMHHTHWLHLAGSNNWSLCIGRDMTLYPYDMGRKQVVALPVSGFTAAGAPVYDPAKIVELPLKHDAEFQMNYSGAAGGDGGKRVLINHGGSGLPNPFDFIWQCFDTESGQLLWSYPNPYFQVHRSHTAPSPQIGLFRGAFGIVGIADYPEPIGTVWVINGNLGEWHMLTEDGYYLSRLFQGDPLKVRFPDVAAPGADMTNAPPGLGGEDFGGSMTQGEDGRMYVQAGKTALWNLRVDGFDKVKPLGSGELPLTQPLLAEAAKLREAQLQAAEGTGAVTIGRRTIRFTGNPAADFQGVKPVSFEKNRGAGVEVWSAWDDEHLYVAWGVQDNTPWVNGAGHAREMYASGDTVDLQLGPAADGGKRGNNRVLGDLRLSIGPFRDKPTAVIYRKVWNEKKPYSVSSGVVENYTLDYAAVVEDVQIEQTTGKGRYVVEAAIPWDVLGFKPEFGHELVGDFGTTHGNPSGNRTRLRTYWNNKQTGLVDDVVFELQINPQNWGRFILGD